MTRSSRWIGRAAVCVLAVAGRGSGGNEPIAEVRWDQTAPRFRPSRGRSRRVPPDHDPGAGGGRCGLRGDR